MEKRRKMMGLKKRIIKLKGDRRGLEMAFNTIVVLVLAVVILAFLIFIFSKAGDSFRQKIESFFTKSNVDNVVENCNNLASSNSAYEYCCVKKGITFSSKQKLEITCANASLQSWGNNIEKLNCEGVC